jgi:hypothetical protein
VFRGHVPPSLGSGTSSPPTPSDIFTRFAALRKDNPTIEIGQRLLDLDPTAPVGTTPMTMYCKAKHLYDIVLKKSRSGTNRRDFLQTRTWSWGDAKVPTHVQNDEQNRNDEQNGDLW